MRKNLAKRNYLGWDTIRFFNKVRRWSHPLYIRQRIRRGLKRISPKDGLNALSLSLSSLCSADCIFCPDERGQRISTKFMPFAYVEKIVNEIASGDFSRFHNIEVISVSANGDGFLNKEIIKILRLIKKRVPHIKVVCFTNFRSFTKDKIDIVLREKLIDNIGCNIDGANAQNYYQVKRTDYKLVKEHLFYFIKLRRRLWRDVPLLISALTLYDYVWSIRKGLNITPLKTPNIDMSNIWDDFELIKQEFMQILDHPKDHLLRTPVRGWAERKQINPDSIDYSQYTCPLMDSISRAAFIAPDGTWYACCWDGNNELALGNVIEESIHQVFLSDKRKTLLQFLENREFGKINGPCVTVNCCQALSCN
jgi:sulfatase maturation enzyme AslB (radical SAM superfamily)